MYTVEDIAKRMGVTEGTIRNYIHQGIIEAIKIGCRYRITREAFKKVQNEYSTAKKPKNE